MQVNKQSHISKLPSKVRDRRKQALAMWNDNHKLDYIAKKLGMKSRGGAYGLIKEAKKLNL